MPTSHDLFALHDFLAQPLAIDPSWLATMPLLHANAATQAVAQRPTAVTAATVAVIPLAGVLSAKSSFMTMLGMGTALDQWADVFRGIAGRDDVKAIILDVNSPGGSVMGLPETAAVIAEVSALKPVVAVSNYLNASAAYWLSSQATQVVASPSSLTGSIGVVQVYASNARALEAEGIDVKVVTAGRYKAFDMPAQPLSEEGEAIIQADIDAIYSEFIGAVAKGRGVTANVVKNGYGEGHVLGALDSQTSGLVDRVETIGEVIARMQSPGKRNAAMRRAEEWDSAPVAAQPTIEELASAVLANLEGTRS